MNPATIHEKNTAVAMTQIIVLICFLRFQSALPGEFFGIAA
jgi:hypothetical protein